MQIQLFHLSVAASQSDVDRINRFLASHRIVNIEKHFVEAGENSFWSLLVNYTSGEPSAAQSADKRIDYKEVLSPDDFAIFSKLRNIRKELAESEGVPVYAVFTNEQLAQIASQRASSLSALASIKGVGKSKVDKYGAAIAETMVRFESPNRSNPDEAVPSEP